MRNSLKQFIARKLKENVPLAEIKQDLKEKGYQIEQINKAVREVIASVDKRMPSTTIIQIGVIVIGVVIAAVVIYLTNFRYSPYMLCNDFSETKDCENAAKVSLERFPGNITKIERTNLDLTENQTKDVWIFEIFLKNKITMMNAGVPESEIKNMRVAVDASENKILVWG